MQGVGVLMDIDIRSIVNTVLLEQTQQTDFSGEKTITTYYSGSFSYWSINKWYPDQNRALFWKRFQAWYREVLLRQVTDGVVYSSNRDSFVNWDMTLGTKWTAEEYTNSQGTLKPILSQTKLYLRYRVVGPWTDFNVTF